MAETTRKQGTRRRATAKKTPKAPAAKTPDTAKQAAVAVGAAVAGGLAGAAEALLERRVGAAGDEADAEGADADDAREEEPQEAAAEEPQTEPSAADGSAAEAARAAKEQLRGLLGNDAESVSGLERCDGGWAVTLEVVEVRRIPDTTDILSSYRLVVRDDHELVSLERVRRYRRSQVEEGR